MTELKNVKRTLGEDRISQRIVNGVSVIEKETHRIIKLVGGRYVESPPKPEPRLVVVDDQPSSFITMDRTGVAGLNAILQFAMR